MIYMQNKYTKTISLFDENYLGHKLIKNPYKSNKYYCEKCKCIIKFKNGLYTYQIDFEKPPVYVGIFDVLDITCDEMIIKEILE